MDYIQSLTEGTDMLTQAVSILRGTRWDATQEEARQYLRSMDMDLTFASGLVADMEANNFIWIIQNLASTGHATTSYKSIALWVRKFGFYAELSPSGDVWEIGINHEAGNGFHMLHGIQEQISRFAPSGFNLKGCAIIAVLGIAVLAFIVTWMFTGSIWTAVYFFEVIFDVLLSIIEMFE